MDSRYMMDFMIPMIMLIAYNAGERVSVLLKTSSSRVFSSTITVRFPGSEDPANGQRVSEGWRRAIDGNEVKTQKANPTRFLPIIS